MQMVFWLFLELWLNDFSRRVMTKEVMTKEAMSREMVVAEDEMMDEAGGWDEEWGEMHVVKFR